MVPLVVGHRRPVSFSKEGQLGVRSGRSISWKTMFCPLVHWNAVFQAEPRAKVSWGRMEKMNGGTDCP